MGRFRISIAGLMAVMIPVAIGLVALREATQLWVDIVFNLVVASLLLATYKAIRSRGTAAVRWAGFSSFGWAHLVLGLIGMPWGQHYGVSPNLLTWALVERVWAYLDTDTSAAAVQGAIARFLVVHSLLSILLGLLGAMVFGFFADRGERAGRRREDGEPIGSSGPDSPAATLPSPPR
jgi:hypothetical protein